MNIEKGIGRVLSLEIVIKLFLKFTVATEY